MWLIIGTGKQRDNIHKNVDLPHGRWPVMEMLGEWDGVWLGAPLQPSTIAINHTNCQIHREII